MSQSQLLRMMNLSARRFLRIFAVVWQGWLGHSPVCWVTVFKPTTLKSKGETTMSEYCKYCGTSARDARSLLSNNCPKHPNGFCKGKHALYEGGERSEYVCVYCGTKNRSLSSLLNGWCPKHPDGPSRGKHVAYDGRENGPYECKYCGREFRDIASMVNGWCPKHPTGPSKGKHSPAR